MNMTNVRSGGCLAAGWALLFAVLALGAPHAGASVRAGATGRCYCPLESPPGAATTPGGYAAVITSRTITPAGGTIGAVSVPGGRVALIIPAGAFPIPVQITLTAPKLAAPVTGDTILTDVGIQVQENGVAYPGTFARPLTLTMRTSSATSSSLVAVWNGKALVAAPDATAARGAATVRFDTGARDFAVLAAAAAPAAIAGATTSMTGEPFLGEGIAAALLLMLGGGGLAAAIRSSRRNRAQCRG